MCSARPRAHRRILPDGRHPDDFFRSKNKCLTLNFEFPLRNAAVDYVIKRKSFRLVSVTDGGVKRKVREGIVLHAGFLPRLSVSQAEVILSASGYQVSTSGGEFLLIGSRCATETFSWFPNSDFICIKFAWNYTPFDSYYKNLHKFFWYQHDPAIQ